MRDGDATNSIKLLMDPTKHYYVLVGHVLIAEPKGRNHVMQWTRST